MNDVENRLAELLKAAVEDPPDNRVTVTAVRHQRARRRIGAAAAAVVAIAVLGVASVGLIRGLASPPPAGPGLPAGVPRYYAEEAHSHGRQYRTVVRATATGTVTGTIRCPLPHAAPLIGPIAADKYQRFFMVCYAARHHVLTDTRIYQFRVTTTGKVRSYAPVRGGDLGAVYAGRHLAVSPDGSQIAVAVSPLKGRGANTAQARIVVINTRTGARATWRNPPTARGAIRFLIIDISFSSSGRQLVFLGTLTTRLCGPGIMGCPPTDQEVRALAPASRGGLLTAGRELMGLTGPRYRTVSDAVISADGSTLTIVTQSSPPGPHPSTVTVSQILLASPAQHVIYHVNGTSGTPPLSFFSPDYSGRHFLISTDGLNSPPATGWINHGRLVKLKPANAVYEAW
jgi:hypothetical protein